MIFNSHLQHCTIVLQDVVLKHFLHASKLRLLGKATPGRQQVKDSEVNAYPGYITTLKKTQLFRSEIFKKQELMEEHLDLDCCQMRQLPGQEIHDDWSVKSLLSVDCISDMGNYEFDVDTYRSRHGNNALAFLA